MSYPAPNKKFEKWMAMVDKHIGKVIPGISSRDLGDQCYYDMWADGVTPREAAMAAIDGEF
jgi:hypothetical protein